MPQEDKQVTLFIAGILAWFAVLMITHVKASFPFANGVYFTGFALFLTGFLAINFITKAKQAKRLSSVFILLQLMGFGFVFYTAQSSEGLILLVIFAGQLPFFLSQKQSIAVLLLINGICLFIFLLMWDRGFSSSSVAITLNLAFQCFALAVANIAVRESESRVALEQANAELMSTRSLLEQTSRQAERLKLSRDLHDICGHQLTGLLLNLEYLSKTLPTQHQQGVNETKQIAKDLLNDIRAVVKQNKASAQLDLNAAIDSLFAHLPHVNAEFTPRLAAPLLSVHHAEVLLRICQEAVSNALRYGSEKCLSISLFKGDNILLLEVSNPFKMRAHERVGSGLQNMHERAAELGGEVTIEQENSQWKVSVRLPYKEQHYD
ncbi:sensor histidine kinase [Alteromonas sp. 14N.309.X.WAT.G.H12]|uniref:sensor histidine kinase n=1 Tax=Alteromonas sp. 14N.309.X.WAT.G.H12 TaxID=3120824 RepID=UPI002FD6887F